MEQAIPLGAGALNELKDWLRITTSAEDALLIAQIRAALSLCEGFTGQALIQRERQEVREAGPDWLVLNARPVAAIAAVEALADNGLASALPVGAYAIDIDGAGLGRVRVTDAGASRRVRISYAAGLAAHWGALPEPLRQGIVRLAAHFYESRDAAATPPAAVTALWRPWRMVAL